MAAILASINRASPQFEWREGLGTQLWTSFSSSCYTPSRLRCWFWAATALSNFFGEKGTFKIWVRLSSTITWTKAHTGDSTPQPLGRAAADRLAASGSKVLRRGAFPPQRLVRPPSASIYKSFLPRPRCRRRLDLSGRDPRSCPHLWSCSIEFVVFLPFCWHVAPPPPSPLPIGSGDIAEEVWTGARSLWKKRGKSGPTMQLFAGFTDDKPVVIGLSKNINRSRSVYLWI